VTYQTVKYTYSDALRTICYFLCLLALKLNNIEGSLVSTMVTHQNYDQEFTGLSACRTIWKCFMAAVM